MGAMFEAVSIGEVYTALKASVEPSKIFFDDVSKSPQEIIKAVEIGLQSIHVESLDEIFDVASEATARENSKHRHKAQPRHRGGNT